MIDTSAFQGKKAAYYTLGCKLNFSETSTFGKLLEDMGVITAQKGERAEDEKDFRKNLYIADNQSTNHPDIESG